MYNCWVQSTHLSTQLFRRLSLGLPAIGQCGQHNETLFKNKITGRVGEIVQSVKKLDFKA